jgi:hypothetical protein
MVIEDMADHTFLRHAGQQGDPGDINEPISSPRTFGNSLHESISMLRSISLFINKLEGRPGGISSDQNFGAATGVVGRQRLWSGRSMGVPVPQAASNKLEHRSTIKSQIILSFRFSSRNLISYIITEMHTLHSEPFPVMF